MFMSTQFNGIMYILESLNLDKIEIKQLTQQNRTSTKWSILKVKN